MITRFPLRFRFATLFDPSLSRLAFRPILERTMSSTINIANLPEPVRALINAVKPPASTGSTEKDQAAVSAWLARLQSTNVGEDLTSVDKELLPKTYLVANHLTLADVALYGVLHPVLAKIPSSTYYGLPSLTRWFDHIQHEPSVLEASSSISMPIVPFDIENAPKQDRKVEPLAKKEKKEKVTAPAEATGSQKPAKEEKKEKKNGKEKAAVASGEAKSAPEKPAKQAKAPAVPAADDSKPIPSMIDLRVGHIIDIKKHPDADGLYVEQIDIGEPEGPRTVVSGLVNYVPIEQMRDRWLVAVCNLKPATMRGVKSFAMVLCATSKEGREGGIEVIEVPEKSRIPGERVYFEGAEFEGKEPLPQLNPKRKIFEAIQPGFITLPNRETAWVNPDTGNVHKIRTKEASCFAPTLVGASLS